MNWNQFLTHQGRQTLFITRMALPIIHTPCIICHLVIVHPFSWLILKRINDGFGIRELKGTLESSPVLRWGKLETGDYLWLDGGLSCLQVSGLLIPDLGLFTRHRTPLWGLPDHTVQKGLYLNTEYICCLNSSFSTYLLFSFLSQLSIGLGHLSN